MTNILLLTEWSTWILFLVFFWYSGFIIVRLKFFKNSTLRMKGAWRKINKYEYIIYLFLNKLFHYIPIQEGTWGEGRRGELREYVTLELNLRKEKILATWLSCTKFFISIRKLLICTIEDLAISIRKLRYWTIKSLKKWLGREVCSLRDISR